MQPGIGRKSLGSGSAWECSMRECSMWEWNTLNFHEWCSTLCNLASIVCVHVCVCVCVCVHIKGRSISYAPCCYNWKRSRFWLSMSQLDHCSYWVWTCVPRGEVTPICTVVTTVISDQIVTVVSGQDIDYKWLVDGQSTTKLSVKTQEIGHVHITCGTSDSDRGPMWS